MRHGPARFDDSKNTLNEQRNERDQMRGNFGQNEISESKFQYSRVQGKLRQQNPNWSSYLSLPFPSSLSTLPKTCSKLSLIISLPTNFNFPMNSSKSQPEVLIITSIILLANTPFLSLSPNLF